MRIRQIRIKFWRHFENIELNVDEDTALICLIGANGTGKSHLLELIAACTHRLGLSPGIEIPRGDPFSDNHEFSLRFDLAKGFSEFIENELSSINGYNQWDRTLTVTSKKSNNQTHGTLLAGGIEDSATKENFAALASETLRRSKDVYFLSLDADRAYPKKNINFNEIAQAYEIDWDTEKYTKGRSYRTSTTLYDEWTKYMLAQENQSSEKLMQGMRRAEKGKTKPPKFVDPFKRYDESLRKVLDHISFTGVDSKRRTMLFDTTGLDLNFNQLSGGEREIAFLVGQIDRFGLRHGLFLLDEPELHLNSDLIRKWVRFLTSTVETGQIWLATHSLEAVEATGQNSTFILERNKETRKVDAVSRLDSRPVQSALSRSVGTPAFSISNLRFVYVEGEERLGERKRFESLYGMNNNIRFIEAGSCSEVEARVAAIRQLAKESNVDVRVGGVVDKDFRDRGNAVELFDVKKIFTLDVHEVENLFLDPNTLQVLADQNGKDDVEPVELIRISSDERSGNWIFQYAYSLLNANNLPEIKIKAKTYIKSLVWKEIESEPDRMIADSSNFSGYEKGDQIQLSKYLTTSVRRYRSLREKSYFWKHCEGKQVLNSVSKEIGFRDSSALQSATFAAWENKKVSIPKELKNLRKYLNSL